VLAGASFVGFLGTARPAEARAFYEGTLGLEVLEQTDASIVLDAGATRLRLSVVGELVPMGFTVAGWEVADITQAVGELCERGVAFRRYEGMDQDELGIWTAPGGGRVAWFCDPDGNTLSLTERP
jgi:catechol 2,3-dioxygenase-like lactoylglutathione lyase family enzyme